MPEKAVVDEALVGFCKVLVKLEGPAHEYVIAPVPPVAEEVKDMVVPKQ